MNQGKRDSLLTDEVAQLIKELAREHDIVQVENVARTRPLAKEVDIGKAKEKAG